MNTIKEAKDWTQQLVHGDPDLWRQVKVAAIMDGKTMTQWVEEALRERLNQTKKVKKGGD